MSNTQTATQLKDYQDQQQTIDTMNKWEQDVKQDIPLRQLKAGDEAKSVASYAMGRDANVGWMSRQKRRMAGNTKKKLQKRAVDIAGGKSNLSWQDNNPTQLQGEEKLKYDIGKLSTSRDFLAFRNDDTFLDYYNKNYTELDRLSKVGDSITDYLGKHSSALTEKKKKEVKAEIDRHKDIKSYYDAKLLILKSPYYTILKKTDVDSMTDQELDERIRKLREMYAANNAAAAGKNANVAATAKTTEILADDPEIVKYFVASKILRSLEKKKIEREKSDALLEGAAFKRQIEGGTNKHHKGYFEILPGKVDLEAKIGAEFAGFGKKWTNKEDTAETSGEGSGEGTNEETESKYKVETETVFTRDKDEAEFDIYGGAEAGLSGKVKLAKGSYKYRNKYVEAGANVSLGAVSGSGSIGAALGYSADSEVGDGFTGGIGAIGEVSGDTVKTRGKIKLHWSPILDGAITAIGGDAKGELRGPSGSAAAFAKAGRMIIETTEGKKEVTGGAIGLTAEASLASASLSGGFTVMGVRIGASITGQLGLVGGTVGIAATSGSIGTEIGLLAGLGVKVKLDVDFSEWTDVISEKLKDLIKPLVRQKLKGTVE